MNWMNHPAFTFSGFFWACLSVPVHSIPWKESSPKWPVILWRGVLNSAHSGLYRKCWPRCCRWCRWCRDWGRRVRWSCGWVRRAGVLLYRVCLEVTFYWISVGICHLAFYQVSSYGHVEVVTMKQDTNVHVVLVTHTDGNRLGGVLSGVCVFVCLSVCCSAQCLKNRCR